MSWISLSLHQFLEDGEVAGDHGEATAAQVAGDAVCGGADVQQHGLAVAHHRRARRATASFSSTRTSATSANGSSGRHRRTRTAVAPASAGPRPPVARRSRRIVAWLTPSCSASTATVPGPSERSARRISSCRRFGKHSRTATLQTRSIVTCRYCHSRARGAVSSSNFATDRRLRAWQRSGRSPTCSCPGLLFYDLGFAGLPAAPAPGTEVWAAGRAAAAPAASRTSRWR